jgi:hypothetical protein
LKKEAGHKKQSRGPQHAKKTAPKTAAKSSKKDRCCKKAVNEKARLPVKERKPAANKYRYLKLCVTYTAPCAY